MYSRVGHVHTALEPVRKVPLAAAASKDLGLDNDGTAKGHGLGLSLTGSESGDTLGGGNAVLLSAGLRGQERVGGRDADKREDRLVYAACYMQHARNQFAIARDSRLPARCYRKLELQDLR